MERATIRFSGNGGARDPDQIQREIDRTREELADTVAAVVERTNVKRRVEEKAQQGAEAARERAVPLALGAAALTAAAIAAWVLINRRDRSRWDKAKSRGRSATKSARKTTQSWINEISDRAPLPR